MLRRWLPVLLVLQGCTIFVPVEDPNVDDAGPVDVRDSGVNVDAGRPVDAGTPDAGRGDAGVDGGSVDAGSDAGVEDGGACLAPPSGMVAWWDGDLVQGTTAHDRLGNHSGTITGVGLVPGVVGSAFAFNGVSVIEVPPSPALIPTTAFTVEGWIRRHGTPTEWSRIACVEVNHSSSSTWVLGVGLVHFGLYFGVFSNQNQTWVETTNPIPDETWLHVAATWDGMIIRAYMNGHLQPESATFVGSANGAVVPFRIGRGETSVSGFIGDVDELSIYERALTSLEVLSLFEAGEAGKCK